MKQEAKSLKNTPFVAATKQFLSVLAEREQAGMKQLLAPKVTASLKAIVGSLTEDKLYITLPKITDIIAGRFGRYGSRSIHDDPDSLTRLGSALHDMSKGIEGLSDSVDAEWLVHVLEVESQRMIEKSLKVKHRSKRRQCPNLP